MSKREEIQRAIEILSYPGQYVSYNDKYSALDMAEARELAISALTEMEAKEAGCSECNDKCSTCANNSSTLLADYRYRDHPSNAMWYCQHCTDFSRYQPESKFCKDCGRRLKEDAK